MKRYVDFIVVGLVGVSCITAGGLIIKNSYDEYQVYYKENYPDIDPTQGATLLSITADYAPGVKYYDNNKAKPIKEDFVVTGLYKSSKEGEPDFEYVLDPKKKIYDVYTDDTFSRLGGTITIEYQGMQTTLNAQLVPVVLESIELVQNPYLTKYESGEYFNKTGIIANALYNDGTKVKLTSNDLFVSNPRPLETTDKEAIVAYESEGITKTLKININVVRGLKNGKIVSVGPSDQLSYIVDGGKTGDASFDVLATYESGNKKLLTTFDYRIENSDIKGHLGLAHYAEVTLKEDTKIKGKIPLIVKEKFEGENGYVIGGTRKEENEYTLTKDGTATKLDKIVFAGGFGKYVAQGTQSYIIFQPTSYANQEVDFTMKVANSNLIKLDNKYWMKPLQINTIADLYVNDVKFDIPNNVILAGCGPHSDYEPLYNVYSTITFKNLPLKIGSNKVRLQFKTSTIGEMNHFNESPSTMNIDWVTFETKGLDVGNNVKFSNIYFDGNFTVRFGDNFDTMDIPLYGVYGPNDTKIFITDAQAVFTKPSGYATIGTHTISAKLHSGQEISKTFTVGDVYLQAENATVKGTDKVVNNTENEYLYDSISRRWYKGDKVTVVKGMDNSTSNQITGETSLSWNFNAAPGTHKLYIKCNNSNFFKADNGLAYTKPCNLEDVIKIIINGEQYSFNVSIPTISDAGHEDWCWMGMFVLEIGDITLLGGKNTIKLETRRDSVTPKNMWNEYAIPRIDWIKITNV